MLFDLSINEDYYKPIRSKSALNGYIEYESKGDKDKILSIRKYLEMIRPYLCDIRNDHKTQGELNVHSGNTVIDYKSQSKLKVQLTMAYKTQSEWKIQLAMKINFISSKDFDETCTMDTKGDSRIRKKD